MNLNKCWVPLFYDKFSGDHNYNNPNTSSKNINYIFDNINNDLDNKMEIKSDLAAINFYNNYFKDFISIEELNKTLYKIKCYIKYKDVADKEILIVDEIYTIIFVNSNELEHLIDNKKSIPNITFFKMLCRFHIKYINNHELDSYNSFNADQKININLERIISTCMKPSIYNVDEKIEQSENILFKLFEYQKYSIKWMLNKENKKSKIKYNINEEVIIGNIFFDIYKQIFYKKNNKKELVFHGGCIIDEVGLGKTVQITALSILNRAKNTNYFYNEYTFRSKATLIICPSQLCGQWKRELNSSINKDYKPIIISILTKRHFDKYTYKDLLDADFIILSFSFLNNKNFISAWTNSRNPYSEYKYNYSDVNNLFVNMGKELLLDPLSSLNNTKVILPIIYWHRIVIDEFHDVYSNKKYSYVKYILNHFNSQFRWCVTATPFTIKNNLFKMINFLTNYNCFHKEKILLDKNVVNFLCTNCFRRNTKESVKQEYKLPPIVDNTIWLSFTPTERAMYNAYLANPNNSEFSVYLRQLCCHPNLAYETKEFLSQCKTLEDIEKMMVIHYKKEVEKATKKVNFIQKKIDLINDKINKKNKIKQIKKKKKKY
jgi:superfamily II DNA or RNA helicase